MNSNDRARYGKLAWKIAWRAVPWLAAGAWAVHGYYAPAAVTLFSGLLLGLNLKNSPPAWLIGKEQYMENNRIKSIYERHGIDLERLIREQVDEIGAHYGCTIPERTLSATKYWPEIATHEALVAELVAKFNLRNETSIGFRVYLDRWGRDYLCGEIRQLLSRMLHHEVMCEKMPYQWSWWHVGGRMLVLPPRSLATPRAAADPSSA